MLKTLSQQHHLSCERLTWSDILHELDSLSTNCEAEAELVLLHHHTSLDKTRTWERGTVRMFKVFGDVLKMIQ